MTRWRKTKAPPSGSMQYVTEDGRHKLRRVWCGRPLKPRWTLYRVAEHDVPRRWVEPYEDYDEDLGEIVQKPGFWSGGRKEPAYSRFAECPDSPSGPTRKASEWIVANKKDEVAG